jgi:hypothetical protein
VNFAEQPASTQWAALNYRGTKLAEVWFKPEGQPFGLTFRVPQSSFQTSGVGQSLRVQDLLKAVGISPDEVESCRCASASSSDGSESYLDPTQRLTPPQPSVAHLEIQVTLKRPTEAVVTTEAAVPGSTSTMEQDLLARWSAILGQEASIDTMRVSMDRLRVEMDNAFKKTLTPEERMYALRLDVHQWTKAKARVPHAAPKVREFVHRATWVMGTPERKKLAEHFKNQAELGTPLPEPQQLFGQLESMLKDRQVLAAQGTAVHQECKNIIADIQAVLRRLQNTADLNARRERDSKRAGSKFFKEVRKWTTGQ